MNKKVLCIGAGYVGGPTMAIMAHKCSHIKFIVADINENKINKWNSDNLPIYEPGLDEVVFSCRNKNLFFTTNIKESVKECDIIFVSVNTPTKTFGLGKGKAADLQYWEKTAREILEYSENNKVIVEKSTLPVRTAEAMERILNASGKGIKFTVLSNPEFMAEGSAVKDLLEPDRVLIGSKETEDGIGARKAVKEIYLNWVPKEKILETNVWSSELSKLTANAFLAQRISSINSISAICEKTGANINEVSKAVGMDKRIGDKFLNPSIGFGGSCFKKDILNLVYISNHYGLDEVARYWENVLEINIYQQKKFVLNIMHRLFNTIVDKKITILGFAFKAHTGDTRESPAIYIAKELLKEKAHLTISDPKALENAKHDLKDQEGQIEYCKDVYKASKNAHALCVLTEWPQYKELDFEKIYSSMQKPAFIFDGRNILDHNKLFNIGFNVFPIGMFKLSHF